MNIETRRQVLINTDPQRRCYNVFHASSELQWTGWGVIDFGIKEERIEERLKFWQELNDYAVSQRGEGARCEFRTTEETP